MQNELSKEPIHSRYAELLMITLVIARGTSFMFSKSLLASMGPLNLLGVRFLVAFLILFPIFFKHIAREIKRDPRILLSCLLLGIAYFLCMSSELIGLQYTTSSTCAFLENSAIILVPLLEAILLRKLPPAISILSTIITMIGIGMITLQSGLHGFGLGEVLCLGAALMFAIAIIINDRASKKYDALTLGIVHVGILGVLAIISSFLFESPKLPGSTNNWLMLLMLALVCTCLGFTLQPVAQSKISASKAGIMFGLNPLTAAVCGWIFMGEALNTIGMLGGSLIILGIVVMNLPQK